MQQYLEALDYILREGTDRPDRTGVGTRSVFGLQMRYNLQKGFPIVTTKKIYFHSIKAELLWFLQGSSDIKALHKLGSHIWDANAQAPYWKPKAKFEGDVGRIYGVQWRQWRKAQSLQTVDQIADVINQIKNNPYSRRLIVMSWNPGELDQVALPPCHIFFQFYVAQKQLSLQMYQRSADMFLGVPFNIASYSLLLYMVAQVTSLEVGDFIHILGDAHIYHNHFAQVKEQLRRKPFPPPQLWLNPQVKDIDQFQMDDIKLINYQHHLPIKAPMAI